MSSGIAAALEPTPEVMPGGEVSAPDWPPVVDLTSAVEEDGRQALPKQVTRHLISGTSAYGASVFLERGAGFLANIISARLGGTQTFGAYSLAISTANQISTYAAGGIGSTAARFSGKYPKGSADYPSLVRALAVVSLVSATIAALGLWFGAGPIAHILHKDNLQTLLRCAWVSAVGVVLLECARGFFVGQRFVAALLTMSLMVGASMVFLLPYAAHHHAPITMIELQGSIALAAVLICCLLGRRMGWRTTAAVPDTNAFGRIVREVWSFGFIQLGGLVCSNLAGWWLTALVARADTTLLQMSFFTIANQLRNIVSLPPSLLTEGSYAVMADPTHAEQQTPQRVMALCCFAALSISVLLGALGIIVVPWALTALYGRSYAAAGAAVAVALATAVAHMGTAPAAARLTIVSIRATAVLNTLWAVFVGAAATLFMLHGGSAWCGMAIYFAAHVLSSVAVLALLRRWDRLPRGLLGLFAFSAICIGALAAMSLMREGYGHTEIWTAAMVLLATVASVGLYLFGKRYAWLPPRSVWQSLAARLPLRNLAGGARV